MFLRFIVDEVDEYSLARAGVFVIAYRLRDTEHFRQVIITSFLELLHWFTVNLWMPNRFNRSGRLSSTSRGICWFRPSGS